MYTVIPCSSSSLFFITDLHYCREKKMGNCIMILDTIVPIGRDNEPNEGKRKLKRISISLFTKSSRRVDHFFVWDEKSPFIVITVLKSMYRFEHNIKNESKMFWLARMENDQSNWCISKNPFFNCLNLTQVSLKSSKWLFDLTDV